MKSNLSPERFFELCNLVTENNQKVISSVDGVKENGEKIGN